MNKEQYPYWYYAKKELKREQQEKGIEYLTEITDYTGQKNVILALTQRSDLSEYQQRKKVDEWCNFLKTNQLPFENVWLTTRVNQKIFDAICCQTNIKALWIKWGVFNNVEQLVKLENLEHLRLGGGASVESIDSIGKLKNLKSFSSACLYKIHDYSFLENLSNLTALSIEGDGFSSMKKVVISSLNFLNDMPQLKRLNLAMVKISDHSYAPR